MGWESAFVGRFEEPRLIPFPAKTRHFLTVEGAFSAYARNIDASHSKIRAAHLPSSDGWGIRHSGHQPESNRERLPTQTVSHRCVDSPTLQSTIKVPWLGPLGVHILKDRIGCDLSSSELR